MKVVTVKSTPLSFEAEASFNDIMHDVMNWETRMNAKYETYTVASSLKGYEKSVTMTGTSSQQ